MVAVARPQAQVPARRSRRPRTPPSRALAPKPAYRRDDLMVIADIAYQYLMNGAHTLAKTLFEGLRSAAPNEAYFALALGLTYDRMGDAAAAKTSYTAAAKLDASDGRPLVNLAELALLANDSRTARRLLQQGYQRAKARGDDDVAEKAAAMLDHLR